MTHLASQAEDKAQPKFLFLEIVNCWEGNATPVILVSHSKIRTFRIKTYLFYTPNNIPYKHITSLWVIHEFSLILTL